MAEPTIERRLQRKYIVMTADARMLERLAAATPEGWELVNITDLDDLGDWHEVLLHRFILLDLDEIDAFDPLDVIRILRTQFQINVPVFCFGGDEDIQDEMRLARADRFFAREEMLEMLPRFFEQYAWGG
ncbi:MAG TPA: hypothetical protein ENN42_11140 [Thioalkalivibrio sp.]|nr:hypothetical protein [Thioalkalivibrio sp.]